MHFYRNTILPTYGVSAVCCCIQCQSRRFYNISNALPSPLWKLWWMPHTNIVTDDSTVKSKEFSTFLCATGKASRRPTKFMQTAFRLSHFHSFIRLSSDQALLSILFCFATHTPSRQIVCRFFLYTNHVFLFHCAHICSCVVPLRTSDLHVFIASPLRQTTSFWIVFIFRWNATNLSILHSCCFQVFENIKRHKFTAISSCHKYCSQIYRFVEGNCLLSRSHIKPDANWFKTVTFRQIFVIQQSRNQKQKFFGQKSQF